MLFLFGLPVLMLAACRTPRKACARAERKLARAVMQCPDLLTQQQLRDTVAITVPGDAGAGEASYTRADIDSVVALCNVLVNRSLRYNTDKRKEHEAEAASLRAALEADNLELRRLRAYACRIDTVSVQDSLFSMRIWAEKGRLKYLYYVHPRTATQVVERTVPRVSLRDVPCPPVGVDERWRLWCIILACVLLLLLARKAVGLWASIKTWGTLSMALLLATGARAQPDSLAKMAEREWLRPATDGKLWHELPPPANLVHAGDYLQHSGNMGQSALWTAVITGAVGAVLHTENPDVGRAVWALGGGATLYFTHRKHRSLRKAGSFLQSGYRIDKRYEIVPDSIDQGPHLRVVPVK